MSRIFMIGVIMTVADLKGLYYQLVTFIFKFSRIWYNKNKIYPMHNVYYRKYTQIYYDIIN